MNRQVLERLIGSAGRREGTALWRAAKASEGLFSDLSGVNAVVVTVEDIHRVIELYVNLMIRSSQSVRLINTLRGSGLEDLLVTSRYEGVGISPKRRLPCYTYEYHTYLSITVYSEEPPSPLPWISDHSSPQQRIRPSIAFDYQRNPTTT